MHPLRGSFHRRIFRYSCTRNLQSLLWLRKFPGSFPNSLPPWSTQKLHPCHLGFHVFGEHRSQFLNRRGLFPHFHNHRTRYLHRYPVKYAFARLISVDTPNRNRSICKRTRRPFYIQYYHFSGNSSRRCSSRRPTCTWIDRIHPWGYARGVRP